MMDDRFEEWLRDSAGDYNEPPETPREEIWQRIVAARTEQPRKTVLPFHPSRRFHFRPMAWATAAAALLAVGVGLGRLTVERPQTMAEATPVATEAPRVSATAYRLTTTEHLSQSEAFLTLFRASIRGRGDERLASATARQLLATNRLLLDSPAASDARTRLLLQDLELVLAEIAQLSPQPRSRDLQMITEGLEQGGVLSRLRTAVPAGTSATQGAL